MHFETGGNMVLEGNVRRGWKIGGADFGFGFLLGRGRRGWA